MLLAAVALLLTLGVVARTVAALLLARLIALLFAFFVVAGTIAALLLARLVALTLVIKTGTIGTLSPLLESTSESFGAESLAVSASMFTTIGTLRMYTRTLRFVRCLTLIIAGGHIAFTAVVAHLCRVIHLLVFIFLIHGFLR